MGSAPISRAKFKSYISSCEKKFPKKYYLISHPKRYLQQGLAHCGAFTVEGICSAYNRDHEDHTHKYHPTWFHKKTGRTDPRAMRYMLRKYGFNFKSGRVNKLFEQERIDFIKSSILSGYPLVVLIGNGYKPTGEYSKKQAFFMTHWISIWGYDDDKEEFYVYDSYVDLKVYKNQPIGNVARSYKDMLRDWNSGWIWFLRNYYISINSVT